MEPENLLETFSFIYQDIRCHIPQHYIPETDYGEQGCTNPGRQIIGELYFVPGILILLGSQYEICFILLFRHRQF
jgi:hypothetical protein